jgi:4-hydroxy-4-methyl-2-oxoglutarate aldolase
MSNFEEWGVCRTPEISDALDRLGCGGRNFAPDIRPILDRPLLAGRARTVQLCPGETDEDYDQLIGALTALIESLEPGDVPVVSCGLPARYCVTGEILSLAAQLRGAPGLVTDGYARDVAATRDRGFAVYCAGPNPVSFVKRARVLSVGEPVLCGGVPVTEGDLIFGDYDGCVAVPSAHAPAVLDMVRADVETDGKMIAALESGTPLGEVLAATH